MTDILAAYMDRIRTHVPTLHITSVCLNSDGLMNDVVIVNHDLVFRFAMNEEAKTLLAYETRLLQVVRRYVSLPVPRIEYTTDGFMHYRLVPGVPLYRHTLLRTDEATQDSLAHELATFLQQLHAIPLDDVPAPPWQAVTPIESRQAVYEKRLAALEQAVYPLLWADQKAWIDDLFTPIRDGRVNLDAFTPALIHRDLAVYHMLHDPHSGHLTGVIDYGTTGVGDVAIDWACLINAYGERFVRRIHRYYPISQPTIDRARFFAGALELEWALHGLQSNDRSWFLVHLGRARDSLPLLTPWL